MGDVIYSVKTLIFTIIIPHKNIPLERLVKSILPRNNMEIIVVS